MKTCDVETLVLSTMNAPYRVKLIVNGLIECLHDPAKMRAAAGPMSSFFYDVHIELQRRFAADHGIPEDVLGNAAGLFDSWSGHRWAGERAA